MKVLKEFVEEKGVEMDKSQYYLRRPRTCIVSATKQYELDYVDKVFRVGNEPDDKSPGKEHLSVRQLSYNRGQRDIPNFAQTVQQGIHTSDVFCEGDEVQAMFEPTKRMYSARIARVQTNARNGSTEYVLEWIDGDSRDTIKSRGELRRGWRTH